jgi:hypothetical protein
MTRNGMRTAAALAVCLALAAGMTGCRVHVDKDANGQDKKVEVDTPFGGVHVNTDQLSAADLGFPAYPGAVAVKSDEHQSADVHLGFGQWEMRVRVASYQTSDSKDKVSAFYKEALSRYGDVITCKDDYPVGTPTTTSQGLTCADGEKNGKKIKVDAGDFHYNASGFELKAGSKRHQHIVGFKEPQDGKTQFTLVTLDLPAETDSSSGKSD